MNMQVDLRSHMMSNFNTYERTDVRDEEGPSVDLSSTGCNARGNESEPTRISDLLNPAELWPSERHPVIRSGERVPVPSHVRAAVWFRDRGKCELCNAPTPSDQPWHLDHIKPWSAGGADDTTNLRVLCERHNIDRGNRVDPTERPRRAATWWCLNCYSNEGWPWDYTNGVPTCEIHRVDPTHHNQWRCPVVRGYRAAFDREGAYPTWHQIKPLDHGTVIAYCAHCRAPGLTSRPL